MRRAGEPTRQILFWLLAYQTSNHQSNTNYLNIRPLVLLHRARMNQQQFVVERHKLFGFSVSDGTEQAPIVVAPQHDRTILAPETIHYSSNRLFGLWIVLATGKPDCAVTPERLATLVSGSGPARRRRP